MGLPSALQYAGNIVESRPEENVGGSFFNNFDTEFEQETWIAKPSFNDATNQNFCSAPHIYNDTTGLKCNQFLGSSLTTANIGSRSKMRYIAGGLMAHSGKVLFLSNKNAKVTITPENPCP